MAADHPTTPPSELPTYTLSLNELGPDSKATVRFQVLGLTDSEEFVSITVYVSPQDQGFDGLVLQARRELLSRLHRLVELLDSEVDHT